VFVVARLRDFSPSSLSGGALREGRRQLGLQDGSMGSSSEQLQANVDVISALPRSLERARIGSWLWRPRHQSPDASPGPWELLR
jgi:hypothetical protein